MNLSIEYSFEPQSRFGNGKPPHREIYSILSERKAAYADYLKDFASFAGELSRIPLYAPADDPITPYWVNTYLPGFDVFALHGFLASERPSTYLEIGSGNSTKFAYNAIVRHKLKTRIVSVDPHPRAEIDQICSQVLRSALEDLDLTIFDDLDSNSIVFIDGSHCCFMGSDVTVFFLEVMPRLKSGTLIQLHDIFLPHDYPPHWANRYYSEQYLLAALLLGGRKNFQIEFPVAFIQQDAELSSMMEPVWAQLPSDLERYGGSFWMRRI